MPSVHSGNWRSDRCEFVFSESRSPHHNASSRTDRMSVSFEILRPPVSDADSANLAALLLDAVEGGASVGFMLPLRQLELAAYWQGVVAEIVSDQRITLVAREAGRIVGSVQ